jgi:hypothetical protein
VKVLALLHADEDLRELLEVVPLGGSQRVHFEERNHDAHQLVAALHGEAQQIVPVVVVAVLLDDAPAPEDLTEDLERRPRRCRLRDRELVLDLPAECTARVADHRDREAPFAVDEADDPLLDAWPFLLIVRTDRIVTAHAHTLWRGVTGMDEYRSDTRVFQHIASCTAAHRCAEGQLPACASRVKP